MTCRVSPWKSTLIIFPSAPHNKNSVSSRGWRSAPRDLTPAQALARYDRRVLRFRRDGPLCDLNRRGRSLAVSAARDDPHSQLLKGSNPYFAATLITHVIPAPKITPAFSKSSG